MRVDRLRGPPLPRSRRTRRTVGHLRGGSKSDAWTQVFADALGRPILLPSDHAVGARARRVWRAGPSVRPSTPRAGSTWTAPWNRARSGAPVSRTATPATWPTSKAPAAPGPSATVTYRHGRPGPRASRETDRGAVGHSGGDGAATTRRQEVMTS
ncbi:hypothetical protein NKH77_53760 [Streptomyces sp. M19]